MREGVLRSGKKKVWEKEDVDLIIEREPLDDGVGREMMRSTRRGSVKKEELNVAALLKQLSLESDQPRSSASKVEAKLGPPKASFSPWQNSSIIPGTLPQSRLQSQQPNLPTLPSCSKADDSAPKDAPVDPQNPFFDKTLTFSQAAGYMHEILSAAVNACHGWLHVPIDEFILLSKIPGQYAPLARMSRDFGFIEQFLEIGREGWDLTHLPDNFFVDVEALLKSLFGKLELLEGYEGCDWLHEKVVVPLHGVRNRLAELKGARAWVWTTTRLEYERSVEQKKEEQELDEAPARARDRAYLVPKGRRRWNGEGDVDVSFGAETDFTSGGVGDATMLGEAMDDVEGESAFVVGDEGGSEES